jgi:hypothetical protein
LQKPFDIIKNTPAYIVQTIEKQNTPTIETQTTPKIGEHTK